MKYFVLFFVMTISTCVFAQIDKGQLQQALRQLEHAQATFNQAQAEVQNVQGVLYQILNSQSAPNAISKSCGVENHITPPFNYCLDGRNAPSTIPLEAFNCAFAQVTQECLQLGLPANLCVDKNKIVSETYQVKNSKCIATIIFDPRKR